MSDALIEQIAYAFVNAFNDRDPEALIAVFHPDAEFRPTVLVGSRSLYQGHAGARRYLDELGSVNRDQRARIRRIRRIGDDRFVVLTEVLVEGEVVSPGAVIVRLEDGKIIEATAHLSDEETLVGLGLIP